MKENIIKKDEYGRVIYEERDDGFYEFTSYYDDGTIKKVETHYPRGQVEIERFKQFTYNKK